MKETDKDSLEKEYFHLQTVVEGFDSKSLTIKAWSVTLASAIAGSSAFTKENIILLFAALVSLMFWFIDGSWKTFQYANYKRIKDIEAFMRGEIKNLNNLQIGTSWGISYHKGGTRRLFKMLFWPHVVLPHGAMFLILILIYLSTFN